MSSYIGSHISLISTSNVRYEGILDSIDPQEGTIALKNVKHWGTEDRSAEQAVEPSPLTYECITFKGENIKNLKLVDQDDTSNMVLSDPAILEVRQAPELFQQDSTKSPEQQHRNNQGNWNGRGGGNWLPSNQRGRGGWNNGWGRGGYGGGWNQDYNSENYVYPQNNSRTRTPQSGRNYRGRNTRGNSRRRGGGRGRYARDAGDKSQNYIPGTGQFLERQAKGNDDADLVIPEQEFDFQANLDRFDMSGLKEALTAESEGNNEDEPKAPNSESQAASENEKKKDSHDLDRWEEKSKASTRDEIAYTYNKDDFFDTLSTNKDMFHSQTGSDMRELNAETFGKIGSTYRCRTRSFRRWRGRGNRTPFRGSRKF